MIRRPGASPTLVASLAARQSADRQDGPQLVRIAVDKKNARMVSVTAGE